MGKYIKYYDAHSEYDGEKDLLDEPNVAWCEQEEDVHYGQEIDYSKQYLTFTIIEGGTLIWNIFGGQSSYLCNISYSINEGNTWIEISPSSTPFLNVIQGQKILFKGTNSYYTKTNQQNIFVNGNICSNKFGGTAVFNISGNIMSMIGGDNFENATFYSGSMMSAFFYFFKDTNVISAQHLAFPTEIQTGQGYQYAKMFYNCTLLKIPPKLPSIILGYNCYESMFEGCTSLIEAPELPAKNLAGCSGCYESMFKGCISLKIAPKLPATTLANECYLKMFQDCSSLVKAPSILPATTLPTYYCYEYMFYNCTSLKVAPELPATELHGYSYNGMFSGCSSLNYIKAMFTTTPGSSTTSNWVSGVSATGTFVKNSAATWTTTGTNGIPTGWTVQTADS